MLFGGMFVVPGVAFLIGLVIFKADESAKRRESRIWENQTQGEEAPNVALEERKRIGSCAVRHEDLYEGDIVASCPYCEKMARRGDLSEWVHVKGACPACGRHLSEDQVQEVQSERKMGKHDSGQGTDHS